MRLLQAERLADKDDVRDYHLLSPGLSTSGRPANGWINVSLLSRSTVHQHSFTVQ